MCCFVEVCGAWYFRWGAAASRVCCYPNLHKIGVRSSWFFSSFRSVPFFVGNTLQSTSGFGKKWSAGTSHWKLQQITFVDAQRNGCAAWWTRFAARLYTAARTVFTLSIDEDMLRTDVHLIGILLFLRPVIHEKFTLLGLRRLTFTENQWRPRWYRLYMNIWLCTSFKHSREGWWWSCNNGGD